MTNDDFGGLFQAGCQSLTDQTIRLGIDRRSRIIQDQNLRIHKKSTRDTETLALTSRDIGSPTLNHGVITLFEILNKFIGLGNLTSCDDLFIRRIFISPAHIFFNRTREKDIGLKNHGHLLTKGIKIVFFDIVACYCHPTRLDIIKTRNQLNQARFP